MEIHQLQHFVSALECGSLRGAAAKLHVSQSALSQSLKKLEESLGCTLIDRTHQPLEPTEYGKIVLPHAQSILLQVREIEEEVSRHKAAQAKKVRVVCFYELIATSLMAQMASRFPDYQFEVQILSKEKALPLAIDGLVDIVILPDHKRIAGFKDISLGEEEVFLSVPVNSAFAQNPVVTTEMLRETPITIPDHLAGVTSWYVDILSQAGTPRELIRRVPIDEYFARLDNDSSLHFRTSLMSALVTTSMVRRHLPIDGVESKREITAYVSEKSLNTLGEVGAFLENEGRKYTGAMQSLSLYLALNHLDNLTMR